MSTFFENVRSEASKSFVVILLTIAFLFAFEAVFFEIQIGSFVVGVFTYWFVETADFIIDVFTEIYKNAKKRSNE